MSDVSENQWKWKVRSSNARVNPYYIKSLQAAKGTLKNMLKK